MTTRRTLASDLRSVGELKAVGGTTAPRTGRHRAETDQPGEGSQPPAWNNSTTVIRTIRDALVKADTRRAADPSPLASGPAPRLERPIAYRSGAVAMSIWTTRAKELVSCGDLVAISILAHADAVGRIVAETDGGQIQCLLVRGSHTKPGEFVTVDEDQLLVRVFR